MKLSELELGLLDVQHDPVIIFEPVSEKVLWVNKRACIVYGFSFEEFLKYSLDVLSVNPHQGKKALKKFLEKGLIEGFQSAHYTKNQNVIFVEINATLLYSEGNQLVVSVNRDISSRVKEEKKQLEIYRKHLAIVHAIGDIIFEFSPDGVFLNAWTNIPHALFLPKEDFLGKAIQDLPNINPAFQSFKEKIIIAISKSSALARKYILEYESPFDQEQWYEATFQPLLNGDIVESIICSVKNITQKRHKDQSLLSALRRIKELQDALDTSNIVSITDTDGIIQHVNKKFEEISGYTLSEVKGKDHGILNSGFHTEQYFEELCNTIKSGRIWSGEINERKKNGKLYWADTTIVPLLDDLGNPRKFISIRHDITEMKSTEDGLRKFGEVQNKVNAIFSNFRLPIEQKFSQTLTAACKYLEADAAFFDFTFFVSALNNRFSDKRKLTKLLSDKEWVPKKIDRYNSLWTRKVELEGFSHLIRLRIDFSKLEKGYIYFLGNFNQSYTLNQYELEFLRSLRRWVLHFLEEENLKNKIEENYRNLKSIFDNQSQGFLLLNREIRLIQFNMVAKKAFQKVNPTVHLEEGISVKSLLKGYSERLTQKITEKINKVFDESVSDRMEVYHQANGQPIWYSVSFTPNTINENVESVVISFQEITEAKVAKAQLEQSEERYRLANVATKDGIVDWEIQTGLFFISERMNEILGYSTGEIDSLDTFKRILGKPAEEVFRISAQTNPEKKLYYFPRKDQSILALQVNKIIQTKEGVPIRLIAAFSDVTKELEREKKLENTLNQLTATQSQLIQQEKMASLGTLTAGVAHELNNPINFMLNGTVAIKLNLKKITEILASLERTTQGHSELNQLKKSNQQVLTLLETIDRGANRAATIVKSLKQFSRQESENMSDCDIGELLNNSFLLLQNELKHIHHFDVTVAEDLPLIQGYPIQLEQVFINLLNNAIQAIDPKIGKISVQAEKDNSHIIVAIEDNGSGIPKYLQKKIFDPFFTTKEVGQGTGLGLSISFGIIKKHKGDITFHSEPGAGTIFTITLPTI